MFTHTPPKGGLKYRFIDWWTGGMLTDSYNDLRLARRRMMESNSALRMVISIGTQAMDDEATEMRRVALDSLSKTIT